MITSAKLLIQKRRILITYNLGKQRIGVTQEEGRVLTTEAVDKLHQRVNQTKLIKVASYYLQKANRLDALLDGKHRCLHHRLNLGRYKRTLFAILFRCGFPYG